MASAPSPVSVRVAEAAGRDIAQPGNEALREIRDDLRQTLQASPREPAARLPRMRAAPPSAQAPNRASA